MDNACKKALFFALGINTLFLVLCLVFGLRRFGAMDDFFMAKILEGAYSNDYNVHLVFVNVLYGYVLLPLYHLFPKISWYYVGEVLAVFVSLTTISFVAIRKVGLQWGPIFATFFVACFASDYYLVLQFTQCASVLSAAGMLAIVYGICQESGGRNRRWILFFVGFGLLFWGAAMRYQAFLMGVPFVVLALLIQLKTCWKNRFRLSLCIVIAFCGTFGLQKIDSAHYTLPEYKKFKEFQPYRVVLGDGNDYDINAVYEDLDESDVPVEDLKLLKDWFLYDKDVFSVDNLKPFIKTIRNHKTQNNLHDSLSKALAELSVLIERSVCWPWILVCLLLLWKNKEKSFYSWLSFFSILLLIGYLFYLGRVVFRVENGFLLYAAVMGIPLLKPVKEFSYKVSALVFAILVIYCTIFYTMTSGDSRDPISSKRVDSIKNQTDYSGFSDYIQSAPDSVLFLVTMQPYMGIGKTLTPHYLSMPFGAMKNFVSLGYWTPYFPDVENTLREWGLNNPVKDAVKENVLVVGDRFDRFLERYHYPNESVEVDTVLSIGETSVEKYRVVHKKGFDE